MHNVILQIRTTMIELQKYEGVNGDEGFMKWVHTRLAVADQALEVLEC